MEQLFKQTLSSISFIYHILTERDYRWSADSFGDKCKYDTENYKFLNHLKDCICTEAIGVILKIKLHTHLLLAYIF